VNVDVRARPAIAPDEDTRRAWHPGLYRRTLGTLAGLAAIWTLFTVLSDVFLTSTNIWNILQQSANVGCVAAGLTVVLIAGEIDLSVGSLEAMAGAVAAVLMRDHGVPVPIAVLAGIAMTVALGAVNGLLAWKFRFPSFIVTLAMLGIAQGSAFLLTNGAPVNRLPDSYRWIGTGKFGPVFVAVLITAAVYIVLHLVLTRTRLGLHIFAVGGNAESAALQGINPGRVKLYALMISGCTAGIGGLILSARLNAGDGRFGEADLLVAVAAVVIGGTSLFGGVGTVAGSAIGVVMIVSIKNGMVLLNVPDFWQRIVVGLIIVGAMGVDQFASGDRQLRMPNFGRARGPAA